MGNKCKRFLALLIMAVLLVSAFGMQAWANETEVPAAEAPGCYTYGDVNGDGLVDQNDAIHLLYYSMNTPGYSLNGRGGEMDGKEGITAEDAIYLLFRTFPSFAEKYALPVEGKVHNYSETWNWMERETVDGRVMHTTLTLKCAGCGHEVVEFDADVEPDVAESVAATCTSAGKIVYKAAVNGYESTHVKLLPATGHSVQPVCTGSQVCDFCQGVIAAKDHTWSEPVRVGAGCETTGSITYTCTAEGCGATKGYTIPAKGHNYGAEVEVSVADCQYVKVKTCSTCGGEVRSEVYSKHSFTVLSSFEAATCSAEGHKVYACDVCGNTKEESVSKDATVHTWDNGFAVDSGKLYTCTGCQETKTVVEIKAEDVVTTADIQDKELTLDEEGTSIALSSDASKGLDADKNIQIAVERVEDSNFSENTVYDFTMNYVDDQGNTEAITDFAGEVVVTLPYTLGEGEDVECILIRYIPVDENGNPGEPVHIEATYANGYITFTTNHFSYYTVTRLTPAERCELYGHKYGTVPMVVAPTCTEEGYTQEICQRCRYIYKHDVVDAFGHKMVEAEDHNGTADCENAGFYHMVCANEGCGHEVSHAIPATGHAYELVEDVLADCTKPGKQVFTCSNEGCGSTYQIDLPQLEHDFQPFEGGVVDPTCTEKGYVQHCCTVCQELKTLEEIPALGHNLTVGEPTWTWVDGYPEVTVSIVCAHDESHTWNVAAVITEEDHTNCEGGYITYVARGEYMGVNFAFTENVDQLGEGHKFDHDGDGQDDWLTDNARHYHQCTVCKGIFDSAAHGWGDGTVVKAPTCNEKGEKRYQCICGQTRSEVVSATGMHNVANGVCVDCGFVVNNCRHYINWNNPILVTLDLEELGGCKGELILATCECGQNKGIMAFETECEFGEETEETRYSELCDMDYTVYSNACVKCGMTQEYYYYEGCSYDPCARLECHGRIWYIGDYVILENSDQRILEEHPTHVDGTVMEIVELADFGLCGGTYYKMYCPCGETSQQWVEDEACDWVWNEDLSAGGTDGSMEHNVYNCTVCGAQYVFDGTYGSDGSVCRREVTEKYTYLMGGQVKFTYTVSSRFEIHAFELDSYKLLGESCLDGIEAIMKCAACGETYEEFWADEHYYDIQNELDLSGYNICCDMLTKRVCLCGAKLRGDFLHGNYSCDWGWDAELSTRDKDVFFCNRCGAKREQTHIYGDRDENCMTICAVVNNLYDAKGNYVITYYSDEERVEHDFEETFMMMEGATSCEEGVRISHLCKHCGYGYTDVVYHHAGFAAETYDVSHLNMCGDTITLMSCACGQDTWLETACENWFPAQPETEMCGNCGAMRRTTVTDAEAIDACHTLTHIREYFFRQGPGELTIHYTRRSENHADVWVMELLDGATSCVDGYMATRTCLNCDLAETYGPWYHHEEHVVERELLATKEQLCGDFYQVHWSCACGQHQSEGNGWANGNCIWVEGYDAERDCWFNECRNCGVRVYPGGSTIEVQEGQCVALRFQERIYERNGQVVLKMNETWSEEWHEWDYTFTINQRPDGTPGNCEDGYSFTAVCKNCGETQEGQGYGHRGFERRKQLIHNGEGICGAIVVTEHRCACGQEAHYGIRNDCEWEHIGWTGDGVMVEQCRDCGIEHLREQYRGETDAECNLKVEEHNTFVLNDVVVATHVYETTRKDHNYAASFELFGETCADGYQVTKTCLRCGDSYVEDTYGPGEVPYCGWRNCGLGKTVIYDGTDICGPIMVEEYTCACGRDTGVWWDYSCDMQDSWDENGNWLGSVCINCGTRDEWDETRYEPDENCERLVAETRRFIKDGVELASYTRYRKEESHNYAASFELFGKTCSDGFRVIFTCQRCGVSYEEICEAGTRGCEGWSLGRVTIYDGTDCCGPIKAEPVRCACGQEQWVNWYTDCQFEYQYEDHGISVEQCVKCGMVRQRSYTSTEPNENCERVATSTYVYLLNGAEVGRYVRTVTEKAHDWCSYYELLDGATSCEEGCLQGSRCRRCGETVIYEEISYEHQRFDAERYEFQDYGICGGYLDITRCACGKETSAYEYQDCNYYYTGKTDPATGAQERYCPNCDTYVYILQETEYDRENCSETGTFHFSAVRDGQVLFEENRKLNQVAHDLFAVDLHLLDGAEDCHGGWTGRYECVVCGWGHEIGGHSHDTHRVKYVDLNELGACGGYLEKFTCACGDQESWNDHIGCALVWEPSYTEIGADGYEHTYQHSRCTECGLEMLDDMYYVNTGEGCNARQYENRTVTFGEVLNETLVRCYWTARHEYGEEYYTLDEGATDCTEGVIITRVCKNCGEVVSRWGSGHSWQNKIESIDLAQYGSICGQTLDHSVCPCGKKNEWRLAMGDYCDLDWNSTDLDWVRELIAANGLGERLVDEWHGVTGNAYNSYSYAYVLTCAVTDPEPCGLVIRQAEYWVKNGCEIELYHTWQLGYDPATGECQREITLATGEKRAHHDHQDSYDRVGLDDGTICEIQMSLCEDCGSYRKTEHFYRNGEIIKSVNEHINTLDNDDNKRYYSVREYNQEVTYEQDGEIHTFYRPTLDRYEVTYSNGEEFWGQDEYIYSEGSGCYCTRIYTSSHGEYYTENTTNHNTYYYSEVLEHSTCTQHGLRHEWDVCVYCQEITWENFSPITPNDHCWCWDHEKQTYVCCTCGLENINGASGSVVMEDLTEKYGYGVNYVIGYWNRDEVRYVQHVSVIFLDRDENHVDGNEFVLDVQINDCTLGTDGFVGKSFSKADAIAAARDAMAEQGYEGAFAIRISFVPENDQTTLDYAITFDPINEA